MNKKQNPLLQGIDQITAACGISEKQFYMLLALKFPARKINGRWFAHSGLIDEFFKSILKPGTAVKGDK